MKTTVSKIEEDRMLVAELIYNVLAGQICVREALEKFPPQINDISLQCAWHALIHFEADEDIRKNDKDYASLQNDFLKEAADLLINGKSLPLNTIEEYNKYHPIALKSRYTTFWDKVKTVFRMIN